MSNKLDSSLSVLERTLIILKPDVVRRGRAFEILNRFETKGLHVVELQKTILSPGTLAEHYRELVEKLPNIAKIVIEEMSQSPVYIAVIEGVNAVAATIQLSGEKTDPNQCFPGTIRFDYSSDTYDASNAEARGMYNVIHRSDSRESAMREIALWLPGIHRELWHDDNRVVTKAADAMRYSMPDFLERLVESANEQKIVFHGVGYHVKLPQILEEGILPLTPEVQKNSPELTPCSYWASGLELLRPEIDGVLFDHAVDRSSDHQYSRELVIAVAYYDDLLQRGPVSPFSPDSALTVHTPVARNQFSLLTSRVHYLGDGSNLGYHQKGSLNSLPTHLMFNLIAGQVFGGIKKGEHLVVEEKFPRV